jgi:hypothetical protein
MWRRRRVWPHGATASVSGRSLLVPFSLFLSLFTVRGFSGPRGLAHSAPAEGGGDQCDDFPLYALL